MATETTAVELITRDSNSDAWSLGCDITIEEMDVVIEEIKLNDIAIAGIVKTDGISVNIDHSNNNIMDLDINVVIDGLNSSILESQVVPYGKVLTITEISTEATYEKGYAASAFSAKKIYDFVSALSNDVKTNKGGIDRLFRDIANILEIINSGGSGGSGGTGDGYWELDAATGDITTNRQVVIKNNLIVHGDTTSTSAGTDPGTSSVIIGVSVNGKEYSYDYINNGILDLSDAFNNIGNLSDYYTKKEIDNKLEGYFEKNDFSRYQSWWDSLINLITKDGDNIKINTNLIVSGDTSSTAQGTNQGSTGIDEQQLQEYLDNNKYITSSYTYSKQEVDDKFSSIDVSGQINAALSGYAKLDDVDSKIDNLNLSQYAKATDLVTLTTRVKAEEDITATYKSWWDDLKSLIVKDGTNNIKINGNLIVAGDTSTGGTGSNPEVAGTLIGIKVNGTTYDKPVNGILTIPDYPTSLEWSAINGKPTKLSQFTNDAGFITSAALNGYAKTADLPTKTSLGLGNVENKSSATIRGEITSANVTNALGYTPANNASLANYLPLSGGTITSSNGNPLLINSTGSQVGVVWRKSGTNKGWVGYDSLGFSIYSYVAGVNLGIKDDGTPFIGSNTLIHSGNIGSQKVERARYIETLSANGQSWYGDSYRMYGQWSTDDYNAIDLKVDGYKTRVDVAGKLKTARTIWGQSFDGTGNVSGNIQGGKANFTIYGYNSTSASNVNILTHDNNKSLWLGYGMNAEGNATIIAGTSIEFRYGASRGSAAFINSSGNVTIGASDLAGTSAKLYVDGVVRNKGISINRASDNAQAYFISEGSTESLEIRTAGGGVPIVFNTNHNGAGERMRIAGNGNVGIGTTSPAYKLDVLSDNYTCLRLQRNQSNNLYGASMVFGNTSGNYGAIGWNQIDDFFISNASTSASSNAIMRGSHTALTIYPAVTMSSTLSVGGEVTIQNTYIKGVSTNPYIRFTRNGINWYCQAYIVNGVEGVFLGSTSAKSLRVDVNGNVQCPLNLVVSGDTSSGSDIRFKDKLCDHRIALSDIADAPLFTFKWNDREDDSVHLGSSAQYWEKVAPWLVKGEDFKTLDYSTLGVAIGISLANKAVNHEERIKILEDKVKALEAENRRLRYGS